MSKERGWEYPPTICQWDITNKCNLECKHCRASGLKESSSDLETEEITGILDQLVAFAPNITIAFVGGDPLMRPDLKEILSFAKKRNSVGVELLTNGTMVTKKNISWLSDLVDGFNISLESANPEINNSIRGKKAFERAVRGIELLARKKVPVAVRMTFFDQKEEEVENLMRFLPQIGVSDFNFRYVVPVGRAQGRKVDPVQYKRLAERIWSLGKELNLNVGYSDPFPELLVNPDYKKEIDGDQELLDGKAVAGCSVGFYLLYLDPSANVRLCPYFPVLAGDAKSDSLENIWFSSETLKAIRKVRNCLEGSCGSCEYKFACGGCLGSANSTGDFLAGDPRCWHKKV
jgi:radical SAM protein with 4Fe4S-binding SPASM domain